MFNTALLLLHVCQLLILIWEISRKTNSIRTAYLSCNMLLENITLVLCFKYSPCPQLYVPKPQLPVLSAHLHCLHQAHNVPLRIACKGVWQKQSNNYNYYAKSRYFHVCPHCCKTFLCLSFTQKDLPANVLNVFTAAKFSAVQWKNKYVYISIYISVLSCMSNNNEIKTTKLLFY